MGKWSAKLGESHEKPIVEKETREKQGRKWMGERGGKWGEMGISKPRACVFPIEFKVRDEVLDDWSGDDIADVLRVLILQRLEGNPHTLPTGVEGRAPRVPRVYGCIYLQSRGGCREIVEVKLNRANLEK